MPDLFRFCPTCGVPYQTIEWPRVCGHCKALQYQNPKPVAVLLVPHGSGLVCIRRGVKGDPGYDKLALPGGFIQKGESWEQAGCREVLEETGYTVWNVRHHQTCSAPDGTLLVFGIAGGVKSPEYDSKTDGEAKNITVTYQHHWAKEKAQFAFPLHVQAIEAYWANVNEDG